MHAMVLKRTGSALEWTELADRQPAAGEIRVQGSACGVCRTGLHVLDGALPDLHTPVIPAVSVRIAAAVRKICAIARSSLVIRATADLPRRRLPMRAMRFRSARRGLTSRSLLCSAPA